ncbi:MAG TPA: proline dehydrogenase family protein, partial [Planctomycetota bacterium]|nr:proline dehydrogenase family protein [Planctomycetota bacterium]
MSWLHERIVDALTHVPRPVMRRLSARYIAGERLDEALDVLADLARRGHPGIVDILGENVRTPEQARAVLREYEVAAAAVAERGLDTYVSVKPTHFALGVSEDLAHELYSSLARRCRDLGLFLRVEMEDHPTTDGTLRVFARLRAEFDNVGIVLQSRLLRTPRDIAALPDVPVAVRMVKGIYLEPPEIAHVEPEPIREAYVDCCERLFARGASISFATHDEVLAERVVQLVQRMGIEPQRYEFQVLLGVREPLWTAWREAGHRVRVYVPYGPDWLAYSLRRLKRNPQILGHVMRATLRLPGR